ncbi:MAG TPA: HAMP domain-containing sensor histidine kinase [Thermoleophilaceae bacterium]
MLAIVALEVPLAISLGDRVDSEVRSQARGQADVVAATAAGLLRSPRRAALQRLAARAGESVRGRVVITDSRGRLIADSTGRTALDSGYASRPEIAAALRGRSVQEQRHSDSLNADILATAVPVLRGAAPAGVVRVTQSVEAVHRTVRRTVAQLALIGAVVLLLGLAAGLFIARQMATPMRRLERTASRVSAGDLSAQASREGSSEQRSLADSFNEMTARLSRMLMSQRDFVADASHQLRTPLTGLRLHLEEARADPDRAAADQEVGAAIREVDRLAAMVDELLVLSMAGERDGTGELVSLGDTARRAAGRWAGTAAEHGILLTAAANGAGRGWCAPADLDRVLDALVENALSYSPEGSEVEIVAGRDEIEILDRGPGLAPGEEEQVMERFHRGRAGRHGPPGTGLGLAIAAELARRWGGAASIRNRPGGGARARVDLPDAGAGR